MSYTFDIIRTLNIKDLKILYGCDTFLDLIANFIVDKIKS